MKTETAKAAIRGDAPADLTFNHSRSEATVQAADMAMRWQS
jgi:hypothetical protein